MRSSSVATQSPDAASSTSTVNARRSRTRDSRGTYRAGGNSTSSEHVGAFLHGRRAVDEHDDLFVGLVSHLQRRHRLDRDDAARPEIDALGRIPEEHRERAGDDDEYFFLRVILMAASGRMGRIAPEPSPRLLQRNRGREVSRPSRLLALERRPFGVLEIVDRDPVIAHAASLGRYGARVILVVAATQDELRGAAGASTLVCGVGPVDAAACTAARLQAEPRPFAVVNVGIAGARTFGEPEPVIGSEAVYCDADDPRWIELRVPAGAGLLAGARRAWPEARVEAIGTSARVGGSTGCEVEAMEGYAVLRAAAIAGVPAIEVRYSRTRSASRTGGAGASTTRRRCLRSCFPR